MENTKVYIIEYTDEYGDPGDDKIYRVVKDPKLILKHFNRDNDLIFECEVLREVQVDVTIKTKEI